MSLFHEHKTSGVNIFPVTCLLAGQLQHSTAFRKKGLLFLSKVNSVPLIPSISTLFHHHLLLLLYSDYAISFLYILISLFILVYAHTHIDSLLSFFLPWLYTCVCKYVYWSLAFPDLLLGSVFLEFVSGSIQIYLESSWWPFDICIYIHVRLLLKPDLSINEFNLMLCI